MSHEFKDDVDRFMNHVRKTVSLRAEAERSLSTARVLTHLRHSNAAEELRIANDLRKDADTALKECEYMVYELIDNAMEEGSIRSRDVDGNTVITSRPNEFGDIIEVTMKHQR